MRILLDCDGVLGDFATRAVVYVNEMMNTSFTVYDVHQYDILEALGASELQEQWDYHCEKYEHSRNMPVYPGAVKFVEDLRSRNHEITVVTSPYDAVYGWCDGRRKWLKAHFNIESRDLIFAKDKSLVLGDVLVDDRADNLKGFRETGILFSQPWNRRDFGPYRAETYSEVLDRIDWLDSL